MWLQPHWLSCHDQLNLTLTLAGPACRYANACSAVVVGTADSMVQTFVVAGEITPAWARQSPACITRGRRLTAIRSEVLHCLCRLSLHVNITQTTPFAAIRSDCHVLSLKLT